MCTKMILRMIQKRRNSTFAAGTKHFNVLLTKISIPAFCVKVSLETLKFCVYDKPSYLRPTKYSL